MTPAERRSFFDRYDDGPRRLKAAWDQLPAEARRWRPGPGKWSAHEVVVHCADSETNSVMRIRYLAAELSPLIVGYDQDVWATTFDYHNLPVDLSFKEIETVRAWTSVFIRALPENTWQRAGKHTEIDGAYTADMWLEIYAEHLEVHERQLLRNLAAWKAR